MPPSNESTKANPLLVVAAWLVVILPTAWGLSYTVKNALKLFAPQPGASAKVTPAAH